MSRGQRTLRGGLGVNEEFDDDVLPRRKSKPKPVDVRKVNTLTADDEHEHQYGPFERSRITGNPHRKCTVPGCNAVSLDEDEDDGRVSFDPPAPAEASLHTLEPAEAPMNNFLFRAVDAAIQARTNTVGRVVVLGVPTVITLATVVGQLHFGAAMIAWGIVLMCGYSIRTGIAGMLNRFLGVRLWLKAAGVFTMIGLLVVTGGAVWPWVATAAIVSILLELLVIDIRAAQSQLAMAETTIE